MRTHELKCWPAPFEAIRDGRKTFEFRRDDRGFEVGDVLRLCEWDPCAYVTGGYTGRDLFVTVTYRLGSEFYVPQGFCVLSIKPVADEPSGGG